MLEEFYLLVGKVINVFLFRELHFCCIDISLLDRSTTVIGYRAVEIVVLWLNACFMRESRLLLTVLL